MANTYRAGKHVRIGVVDEHSYNMFLSVMQQCYRLGLWETILPWYTLQSAWHRVSRPIGERQVRKIHVNQKAATKGATSGANTNGNKVSP